MRVYYKSILSRTFDYLHTNDYVWRWETTGFGAQNNSERNTLSFDSWLHRGC